MFPLTLAVFFASGVAALVYQVVWQRLLAIFSGADVYSATVIVAAFMGGLGIGHLAGGHAADRVSRRASLALFAAAEAAIALFGAFSAALYYGVLYLRLGELAPGRGAMPVVLFVSLLWPTFFMGASLPLLARAMTDRIDRAASAIGRLYGFNTLGAATGAFAATWFLLPSLGLEGSLQVGAALNAACAAAVLPLVARLGREGVERGAAGAAGGAAPPPDHRSPMAFWVAMYALSGFVALSFEILWFRLLGVMVKSTAFTFGTLLALYLGGLGLGAAAGSRLARRLRRPDLGFLLLQGGAGLLAALLLLVLVGVADDVGALRGYFGSYEPLSVRDSVAALRVLVGSLASGAYVAADVPANFLRFYVGVPILLVVPPTFLMGCAFPLLQQVAQTDAQRLGRRLGTLLLANIGGSILGTILTGSVALAFLGTAGTLKLLVAASGVFLVAAARRSLRWSRTATAVAAAVVTLAAASMPSAGTLWARLHGTTADRIVFAEDHSGLSVIKSATEGFAAGEKIVFVNGVGQSVIPYGGIHTALGAVPALLHPRPRAIALVGLGSGDTAFAAAVRPETQRVVCIEIIGPQLRTLHALAGRDPYGGLHALLRDPRIEHVVGDGRAYLMRTPERFDIIEADALRPTSAYAGNLYSDEYFRLVRARLAPGGLAATWVPTQRVHDTFVSVFPYVVSVPGILLGSSEPIHIDQAVVSERLLDVRTRAYFDRAGIDLDALARDYLDPLPTPLPPGGGRAGLELNTDLFPRDEFDLSPSRR